jgi:hypothetical protein
MVGQQVQAVQHLQVKQVQSVVVAVVKHHTTIWVQVVVQVVHQ